MKTRHTRHLCILFTTILLWLPLAHAQQGALTGLDEYVTKALKDWDIPGTAIAVVKDDSVVYVKGYGVRRLGERAPVDEHSVFGIASCTKAFTAASIAILVDEGKLGWDDLATKYLPWFQLYDPYVTRELTVRDLLCHRNGLPAFGGDLMWWGASRGRDEILRRVRYVKPVSSFRSRYAYQNTMFIAAGQIIPAITGKSWEDFVRERFFEPLGMTSTYATATPLGEIRNVVSPHMKVDGTVRPISWRNVDNGGPAGSINSNVTDLAQWAGLQLGRGVYKGKRIFSAGASREMWASQTVIGIATPATTLAGLEPRFQAYGLGWGLRDYRGRKIVRHFGETDGMSSLVALIPDERIGVVILANMHTTSMHEALSYWIFDAYLGVPRENWSARFLEVQRDAEKNGLDERKKLDEARDKSTTPSLPLQRYAGTYENDVCGRATVGLEKGKLIVRLVASPTGIGDLEHWQYDTFASTWRDPVFEKGFVKFILDGQGKVDHMKLRVSDYIDPSEYAFKKVAEPSTSSQTPR